MAGSITGGPGSAGSLTATTLLVVEFAELAPTLKTPRSSDRRSRRSSFRPSRTSWRSVTARSWCPVQKGPVALVGKALLSASLRLRGRRFWSTACSTERNLFWPRRTRKAAGFVEAEVEIRVAQLAKVQRGAAAGVLATGLDVYQLTRRSWPGENDVTRRSDTVAFAPSTRPIARTRSGCLRAGESGKRPHAVAAHGKVLNHFMGAGRCNQAIGVSMYSAPPPVWCFRGHQFLHQTIAAGTNAAVPAPWVSVGEGRVTLARWRVFGCRLARGLLLRCCSGPARRWQHCFGLAPRSVKAFWRRTPAYIPAPGRFEVPVAVFSTAGTLVEPHARVLEVVVEELQLADVVPGGFRA
jgi:hypothetical protein